MFSCMAIRHEERGSHLRWRIVCRAWRWELALHGRSLPWVYCLERPFFLHTDLLILMLLVFFALTPTIPSYSGEQAECHQMAKSYRQGNILLSQSSRKMTTAPGFSWELRWVFLSPSCAS